MRNIKLIINIFLLTLLGGSIIVFAVLYINTFSQGFVYNYSTLVKILAIFFATVLTVLSIIFMTKNKPVVYKSIITLLVMVVFFLVLIYILETSGFLDRIDSVEDLQNYISQYGDWAKLMFVLIQFLQVAVIPIPGFITITAGVALFGPWLGGILSFIGIMIGSVVAFFIGRKLGYKAASWLVGEEDLKKWMNKIKGKDKLILTFMFLFPFFPDDVLCFVAGLSTMSTIFFLIMITITRILSIFGTTFSINGNIIPFNTWWGILLWIVLILICGLVFNLLYKKGDNIQKYLNKRKKIKNKHK
jgi:uncharacterized membrane protein YdjX (TVP38/TMEM64 family)